MALERPARDSRATGNVAVVGSVNADFVISVTHLPAEGETVGEGEFAQHWGGKGANQATVAAKHGARVAMIGAVGDDVLGVEARSDMERHGVDVGRVKVVPGAATGAALVMVDREGRNIVAVAPGANAAMEPEDVSAATEVWSGVHVVLVCFEVADPVVLSAVEAGVRQGAIVILNPAPARPLPEELRQSGIILTPNEHEVVALAGDPDAVSAGEQMSAWIDAPVVVTLGEKGAVVCVPGESPCHVPAPKVVARDATGAGDAFNGTLAASLADGSDLKAAVRRAVAAASLSVRAVGARGGIPTRQEVDDLLRGSSVDGVPLSDRSFTPRE